MNLVVTVLEIVAPVFLLAGVGYVWCKLGFEYRLQFVTQLAMTLALPCLIFSSLMQSRIEPQALTALFLAAVVAYAAVTVAFLGLIPILGLKTRTYAAPLIFGNTGNLGLPLAFFAFGEVGLSYAIVVFAIMAIWSFTFGIWLVAGAGSFGKVLREPMVWATMLGALFLLRGWQTPVFLTNALELIGQMAIPMMLITLGVAVARLSGRGIAQSALLSLLKLALCTGIAWSVGRYFELDKTSFAVLVLQVATPVAVTSYLLAEKYQADPDAVAGLVVVSTLIAVCALPLILGAVL